MMTSPRTSLHEPRRKPAPLDQPTAPACTGRALETSGELMVAGRKWLIEVIPDKAPEIAFDGQPRRSANGALEIRLHGQG